MKVLAKELGVCKDTASKMVKEMRAIMDALLADSGLRPDRAGLRPAS